MAEEIVKRFPELSSYSSVAKKNKNELRKICRILELPSEKLGKNALINIVCNSLKISTSCSKPDARDSNTDILFTSGDGKVPAFLKITPAYLQHVKGWVKSLQGFPSQLDTRAVGNYLLGDGFTHDQVVKYKTNRAWDHKRGIHSVSLIGCWFSLYFFHCLQIQSAPRLGWCLCSKSILQSFFLNEY